MTNEDRPTYVYLVEGEPRAGTLADWASAQEHAHYAGLDVSSQVWRHEDGFFVSLIPDDAEAWRSDDYGYHTVCVGDDQATIKIDLRA